ncbi:MAG: hypothetical protein LIO90_06325 [Bacteroidales bacterium]|nr:hypothetical protein [Bacteroidales bacterium]
MNDQEALQPYIKHGSDVYLAGVIEGEVRVYAPKPIVVDGEPIPTGSPHYLVVNPKNGRVKPVYGEAAWEVYHQLYPNDEEG